MLNLSGANIGIENPSFYIPAESCSLREYLRHERQDFTFQRMMAIWRDTSFEQEFCYRFLSGQTAAWNWEGEAPRGDDIERFITESGIERVPFASDETSSEMAVRIGRKVLEYSGCLAHTVKALIYYHSTLNQDPSLSIACQLQHELGLRKAFVSSLSQSGGNASLLAVKVASEMLIAEPEIDHILLIGSEKLVDPYPRLFGAITAIGDSASGMLVNRDASSLKILAIHVRDVPEWRRPYNRLEAEHGDFNGRLAPLAALLIEEVMAELYLSWNDVAMLLPPNLGLGFAKKLSREAHIPEGKLFLTNVGRFGHLLTSDLALNLATVAEEKKLKAGSLILALNLGFRLSMGCMALQI
jgi:3-oxoacyl-[acyl-carrier-protein] synthase III